MLKWHEMFPLWAKLILILSIIIPAIIIPGYVLSNNSSWSRSYKGCIPVPKNAHNCNKGLLFKCVAANTSQFRIPVLGSIEFTLEGNCKALLKDISSSQIFKMKVFINDRPPQEKGNTDLAQKEETYSFFWQGGYTKLDFIKTFKNFTIFIFPQWAADSSALPTYCIYLQCPIDKPAGCFN